MNFLETLPAPSSLKALQQQDHFTAFWKMPFADHGPVIEHFSPDTRLSEVVATWAHHLPMDFADRGIILLGGHEIKREHWHRISPKNRQKITLHYPLAGGGKKGGKQGSMILLAVATVLTAGAASAGAFAVGGLFAQGTLSATVLSGGITFLGGLAQRALSKPPASEGRTSSKQEQAKGPASLSGNVLQLGADKTRVLGTRRVFPALVTQPYVERIGDDEIAEGVFMLKGAHRIRSPQMAGADIEDAEDIEIEIREGLPDDLPISLVERYTHSNSVNVELTPHQMDSENTVLLDNLVDPTKSLPVWSGYSSAKTADEIILQLLMPEGFSKDASTSSNQLIPLRLRMKQAGSNTYFNLPQLHFCESSLRQLKPTIRLVFGLPAEPPTSAPANTGMIAAFSSFPGQSDAPVTENWIAHASFFKAGSNGFYRGNESASEVTHVELSGNQATLYLDPQYFPKGRWQIEMKRGYSIPRSQFNNATGAYGNAVRDFFYYRINNFKPQVDRDFNGVSDRIFLSSVVSIVNDHPIKGGKYAPGDTLIAVKVRNRELREFSVEASSLQMCWDGTGFNDFGESSNPADHIHHIFTEHAARPLPEAIIDVQGLGEFWQYCDDNDLQCDMVVEGSLTDELLNKVAGCGYAMPYQSEVWGVIIDKDRSGEEPEQIFSSRNMADFATSISFNRLPDALRCIYVDEDTDKEESFTLYREGKEGIENPLVEEIRYEGIKSRAKLEVRIRFDFKQMELRPAFYTWKAPAEAIACRRGSLVEVNQLALDATNASARIASIDMADGELTAIRLDADVTLFNELDMHAIADMHSVKDMHRVGLKTAFKIRRSDGMITTHQVHSASITGQPTRVVRLQVPVLLEAQQSLEGRLPISAGNLVTFGRAGSVNRRVYVTDMKFEKSTFIATLTGVAEGVGLHS